MKVWGIDEHVIQGIADTLKLSDRGDLRGIVPGGVRQIRTGERIARCIEED